MRKLVFLSVLVITVFLTITTGCAYIIRYDGPYEGQVIDADTKQPIEGVVVHGIWYKEVPNVAGSSSTFYDAKETVTDKNGEFKIPGLGLKIFSYVGTMNFVIFKSGYEHLGYMPWESLKEAGLLKERITWESNKAIIPIKKLSLEERRNRFGSYYSGGNVPKEQQMLLLKEIEKENREVGR